MVGWVISPRCKKYEEGVLKERHSKSQCGFELLLSTPCLAETVT